MFGRGIGEGPLREMLSSTLEAAVLVQDERILLANAASATLTGFPEAELRTLPFTVLLAADDQKRAERELQRRVAGQAAEPRPVYRMRRKDGGVYWAEVHAYRVAWQDKPAVLVFFRPSAQKTRAEDKKAPKPDLLDPMGRDGLTGLYDFDAYVEELERIDIDENHPITLILAELDDLEATREHYGPAAGDERLRTFAGFLRKETRAGDFVARIEGSRFAILLKRTDAWMAEGIQRRIDDDLAGRTGQSNDFSASFGMGTKVARTDSFGPVFQEAVRRLEHYRRMMRR